MNICEMMHCSSHYETHCILHIHPLNTRNSIPECTPPCVLCEECFIPLLWAAAVNNCIFKYRVWVWTSITHVTISIKGFVKTEFSHQSRVVNVFLCKFLLISLLLLLRLHSDCRNHHRSPTVAERVTEYILDAVPASCMASFFLFIFWLCLYSQFLLRKYKIHRDFKKQQQRLKWM